MFYYIVRRTEPDQVQLLSALKEQRRHRVVQNLLFKKHEHPFFWFKKYMHLVRFNSNDSLDNVTKHTRVYLKMVNFPRKKFRRPFPIHNIMTYLSIMWKLFVVDYISIESTKTCHDESWSRYHVADHFWNVHTTSALCRLSVNRRSFCVYGVWIIHR